jgi:hypothetical protein
MLLFGCAALAWRPDGFKGNANRDGAVRASEQRASGICAMMAAMTSHPKKSLASIQRHLMHRKSIVVVRNRGR